LRAAASLLWIAANDLRLGNSKNPSYGVLPVELGIGFRPTPGTSVALFGRAGLLHAGGGIEIDWTPDDWAHDGLVVRLAPTALMDSIACWGVFNRTCSSAAALTVEAGVAY